METLIIIVIVVVIIAAIAVVALMAARRRKEEERRRHADELRTKASAQSGAIEAAQREAAAEQARADAARLEAQEAEQRAAEAQRGLQFEEAQQEDSLRTADTVDPDVDHRSDGYRPGAAGSRENQVDDHH